MAKRNVNDDYCEQETYEDFTAKQLRKLDVNEIQHYRQPSQARRFAQPVQQTVFVQSQNSGCRSGFLILLLFFGLLITIGTGGWGIFILILGFPIVLLIMMAL